jgi:uncharacterized protein (UPF0303 family)
MEERGLHTGLSLRQTVGALVVGGVEGVAFACATRRVVDAAPALVGRFGGGARQRARLPLLAYGLEIELERPSADEGGAFRSWRCRAPPGVAGRGLGSDVGEGGGGAVIAPAVGAVERCGRLARPYARRSARIEPVSGVRSKPEVNRPLNRVSNRAWSLLPELLNQGAGAAGRLFARTAWELRSRCRRCARGRHGVSLDIPRRAAVFTALHGGRRADKRAWIQPHVTSSVVRPLVVLRRAGLRGAGASLEDGFRGPRVSAHGGAFPIAIRGSECGGARGVSGCRRRVFFRWLLLAFWAGEGLGGGLLGADTANGGSDCPSTPETGRRGGSKGDRLPASIFIGDRRRSVRHWT